MVGRDSPRPSGRSDDPCPALEASVAYELAGISPLTQTRTYYEFDRKMLLRRG